ncbi:zinc transport system permease protein [Seinonella peptonophila]|uniref:Zinc transport system permease protein n=1 Tax=Seinonella peptonophila TaxID=112248 RepID=A0A1M4X6L0_9BACL|nr:metal ABC transporter permease [Seinonella peptonophila]SHE89154.1 zinc transport system permease protein [Seinonella peptonophila]
MIFTFSFMQQAFIAGVIVGFLSPLVGLFLVVRRLSLIAEALSHVNLSGIAAGLLVQKNFPAFAFLQPLYFGMFFSLVGSLFVERIRRLYRTYQELAIPIMLSFGMAVGVIFISASGGFNADVAGYLFGNILNITVQEVKMISIVGLIVLLVIVLLYKELFALSFDEEYARLMGIRHHLINGIFILLVALVISISIRVVGSLLVSALMTIPVASSLQIAKSFRQALLYAIIFAELAVMIGLIGSYYLNWASGGTIVLVSVCIFFMTVAVRRWIFRG